MKQKNKVSLKTMVRESSLGSESPRAGCMARTGGDGTKGRHQRCCLMIRVLVTIVWETEEELSSSPSAEVRHLGPRMESQETMPSIPHRTVPNFFFIGLIQSHSIVQEEHELMLNPFGCFSQQIECSVVFLDCLIFF